MVLCYGSPRKLIWSITGHELYTKFQWRIWDSQVQPAFPRLGERWVLDQRGRGSGPENCGEKAGLQAHFHPPHPVQPFWRSHPVPASRTLFLGSSPGLCLWSAFGFSLSHGFSTPVSVLPLPTLPSFFSPTGHSRSDRDRLWVTRCSAPLWLLAWINMKMERYVHVRNTCWFCRVPWLVTHFTLTWTSWHF